MTDPVTDPTDPTPPDPTTPPEPPPDRIAALEKDIREAVSALDRERKARARYESEVTKLKQGQMNDADKAIAAAREEGKVEAFRAAGARLAAAEFRARAAAKLGDLAGALDTDLIDFARFVGDDGEPDTERLDAAVEKLAAALPAPAGNGTKPAPQVPAGPRPDPGEQDWLRTAMTAGKG